MQRILRYDYAYAKLTPFNYASALHIPKTSSSQSNRLKLTGGEMTGPISFGNDRSIGSRATGTQLDIHAGKVDIRMIPENAVGNDISKCVNIRDTGTGKLYPVATATPPQEFDLPLAEGFSSLGSEPSTYWKNQFGEVTVILQVKKNQPISDGEIAAYLPAGFSPSMQLRYPCLAPASRSTGFLYVFPNGEIAISFSPGAFPDVLASFTFLAAN